MNLEQKQHSTYKQRLMGFIGHIFIEDYHLGVVERNSQFGEFLQPGWHPPLSSWNERLIAKIPIKLRTLESSLVVQAADGFAFEIGFYVSFTFDPSRAIKKSKATAVSIALSRNVKQALEKIVGDATHYGLQKVAGTYTAEQLISGNAYIPLTRGVRHHLQAVLSDLGILIRSPDSVVVKEIIPPESLKRVHQTNYQRHKTIELLKRYPQLGLQAQLLEMLEQQDKMLYMNYHSSESIMEAIYREAFSTSDRQQNRKRGKPIIIEHAVVSRSNGSQSN